MAAGPDRRDVEDGRRRLARRYALLLISAQHANEGAHGLAMTDKPATTYVVSVFESRTGALC